MLCDCAVQVWWLQDTAHQNCPARDTRHRLTFAGRHSLAAHTGCTANTGQGVHTADSTLGAREPFHKLLSPPPSRLQLGLEVVCFVRRVERGIWQIGLFRRRWRGGL